MIRVISTNNVALPAVKTEAEFLNESRKGVNAYIHYLDRIRQKARCSNCVKQLFVAQEECSVSQINMQMQFLDPYAHLNLYMFAEGGSYREGLGEIYASSISSFRFENCMSTRYRVNLLKVLYGGVSMIGLPKGWSLSAHMIGGFNVVSGIEVIYC